MRQKRHRGVALADRTHVARRYQCAIRIDSDLGEPAALEGFICPRSSAEVLETMARHVTESGQGAFTWTGPYGSGKSSLAVALSAALNGDKALRRHAASILGPDTMALLRKALPPRPRGWRILPVVGRRDSPAQVIGEAIRTSGLMAGRLPRVWTEQRVLESTVISAVSLLPTIRAAQPVNWRYLTTAPQWNAIASMSISAGLETPSSARRALAVRKYSFLAISLI